MNGRREYERDGRSITRAAVAAVDQGPPEETRRRQKTGVLERVDRRVAERRLVVQKIAREMRSESRQLAEVLKDLERSANALKRAARAA